MFKKLLGLSILLFFTTPVFADFCAVGEESEGTSEDGRFRVTVEYNDKKKRWVYTWRDTQTKKEIKKTLSSLKHKHQHFNVYVSADGKRFALLDTCTDHWTKSMLKRHKAHTDKRLKELQNPNWKPDLKAKDQLTLSQQLTASLPRLFIFTAKTGRRAKQYSMKDLAHNDSIKKMSMSMGHIAWLDEDNENGVELSFDHKDKLSFESSNGAVVEVSLSTLKRKIIQPKSKKDKAKK